jgi:hypothetical protein
MEALIALLKTDSNAANAFGALASAATAFLALLVSAVSVGISVWAVQSQRRQNQLSVRPLAAVTVADYENKLRVKLVNNGTGPMIVTAVTVSDGSRALPSVLEWMPSLPKGRAWNTFSQAMANRSLAPGGEVVLLELTEYDEEQGFAKCRDIVRAALAPLTVNIEYTDIYNTVMPPHKQALSWFGRHSDA